MFFFFSGRRGLLQSLVISLLVTVVLLFVAGVLR
jgi:hypothetical protein